MSTADKKRLAVITYPEVIGLFITFLAVLYLLYPKAMLEQQILAESSNYDLTATYLENMLRLDPSNKKLMLVLAKTAQKSGKNDLALKLLDVLLKDKETAMSAEILELKYRLLRSEYQYASSKVQEKIRQQLSVLMKKIEKLDMATLADKQYWYAELVWHGKYAEAFQLTEEMLKQNPENIFWLKQCYIVALKMKNHTTVQKCLDKLLATDTKEHEYWLVQAYYFARQNGDEIKAEQILGALKQYSQKWTEEEARLALENGFYLQASDIYLKLSEHSKEQKERKKWFLEALSALQQGSLMKEAVILAKKYEKIYIDDSEMMKIFLKLYLSADNLDAASQLSRKLLEKRGSQ